MTIINKLLHATHMTIIALAFFGLNTTSAHAQEVAHIVIDTKDLRFYSDDPAIVDTRQVTNALGGPVGHLYASDQKDFLLGMNGSGSALTYNPMNKKDLWLVTCAHCVTKVGTAQEFKYFEVYFPQTGEMVSFTSESKIFVGSSEKDIAVFDMPDDLMLKPARMDPLMRGPVYSLASTVTRDKKTGGRIRVFSRSGVCSLWEEEAENRNESQAATNCPASLGSSGSPIMLYGTSEYVIVAVLNNLETTKFNYHREEMRIMGNLQEKRRMVHLASIN